MIFVTSEFVFSKLDDPSRDQGMVIVMETTRLENGRVSGNPKKESEIRLSVIYSRILYVSSLQNLIIPLKTKDCELPFSNIFLLSTPILS